MGISFLNYKSSRVRSRAQSWLRPPHFFYNPSIYKGHDWHHWQIWQRCCNSPVLSDTHTRTHAFCVCLVPESWGWDWTGLRPVWWRPCHDTHHSVARCSFSCVLASTNNEGAPVSLLAAGSKAYCFCFICWECQHCNPSVAFWSSADAVFFQAKCKSTRRGLFVCTRRCNTRANTACVIHWCGYCK